MEAEGTLSDRRRRNLMNEVLGIATMRLRHALEASMREEPEVQALLDEVVARRLDPASAASAGCPARSIPARQRARTRRAVPGDHSSSYRRNYLSGAYSRIMRWAIAMFACAALLAALPAPARAQTLNGQLAAVADGRLVTVNADGSGLRTLWTPQGRAVRSPGAAWSPDGNRLAFPVRRADRRLRRRGSARHQDHQRRTATRAPAGRADGRRIGFVRRWEETMIVPAEGGRRTGSDCGSDPGTARRRRVGAELANVAVVVPGQLELLVVAQVAG